MNPLSPLELVAGRCAWMSYGAVKLKVSGREEEGDLFSNLHTSLWPAPS